MKNRQVATLTAGLLSSVGAFAAGPDFSTLSTAIDFSTLGAVILGAAAAILAVRIIFRGGKEVNTAVKSM